MTAQPRDSAPPRHLRVLTVCTGNIHRSPAAQFLLAEGFGPHSGIVVASAGTRAVVDAPVGEQVATLLRADGIDAGSFAARRITEPDVRSADLILGMTRAHRGHAATLWPASVRRNYTLKEFARAAERVDPEELSAWAGSDEPRARLLALTELASRNREPAPPEADDIVDPDGQGDDVVEQVYREIREAVLTIVGVTRVRRGRRSL